MQILARSLAADLFNCKSNKLTDFENIKEVLSDSIQGLDLHIVNQLNAKLNEDHCAFMAILQEGHVTLHVYPSLSYVAVDLYLLDETADLDKVTAHLRSFFKPEKVRSTVLKRGNRTTPKELRPKVKTRIAPMRKIHNTGAKVIRILAHRNNN